MADWRTTFAKQVADQTGLNEKVVYAWTLAENRGDNHLNPLNIRNPQTHNFDPFPSTAAAARATAQLLLTSSNYTGIRRAAKSGDPSAQIDAIALSPWDAGHYRGGTSSVGTTLRGAYASIGGSAQRAGALPQVAAGRSAITPGERGQIGYDPVTGIRIGGSTGSDLIPGPGALLGGAAGEKVLRGPVGDAAKWIEDKSLLALLYVTLTLLALLLVLGGLTRTTGLPLPVLRLGGGSKAAAGEIPF